MIQILQGSVFDLLPTIAPGSVDCVVTSPPYWMLRSYLPKSHALKPLELGAEPTPQEFVANMVKVFSLVRETMADHATCWLNIGDTYSSHGGTADFRPGNEGKNHGNSNKNGATPEGIDAGNLCLIPQRLAIALQEDGWLVRSIIVWHKPAPMPASVAGWRWMRCRVKVAPGKVHRRGNEAPPNWDVIGKSDYSSNGLAQWVDCPGCKKCEKTGGYVLRRGSWRPTSSWEPVLMLAKSPGYYCDGEAVKQPAAAATISRDKYTRIIDDPDEQFAVRHDHETVCNGANLRDVWTIASEPLKEKHYAAFPSELVYRCLAAGTNSKGYCVRCGKPWARILEVNGAVGSTWHDHSQDNEVGRHETCIPRSATHNPEYERKTLGWSPSCQCFPNGLDETPRPGLVLDPFSGSGRTGIQAQRLGLDYIGCELNPEYVEMSRRLLHEANPLFN